MVIYPGVIKVIHPGVFGTNKMRSIYSGGETQGRGFFYEKTEGAKDY